MKEKKCNCSEFKVEICKGLLYFNYMFFKMFYLIFVLQLLFYRNNLPSLNNFHQNKGSLHQKNI